MIDDAWLAWLLEEAEASGPYREVNADTWLRIRRNGIALAEARQHPWSQPVEGGIAIERVIHARQDRGRLTGE